MEDFSITLSNYNHQYFHPKKIEEILAEFASTKFLVTEIIADIPKTRHFSAPLKEILVYDRFHIYYVSKIMLILDLFLTACTDLVIHSHTDLVSKN